MSKISIMILGVLSLIIGLGIWFVVSTSNIENQEANKENIEKKYENFSSEEGNVPSAGTTIITDEGDWGKIQKEMEEKGFKKAGTNTE